MSSVSFEVFVEVRVSSVFPFCMSDYVFKLIYL